MFSAPVSENQIDKCFKKLNDEKIKKKKNEKNPQPWTLLSKN